MSVTCEHGHESAATDYCDVCGARIDPTGTTAILDAIAPEPIACARCGAALGAGEQFCEACGHDAAAPAADLTAETPATAIWTAVVTVDAEQFARAAPDDLELPDDPSERVIALDEPTVRIGRGRGDIALDDPAVSKQHADLVRQDDGGYAVVDLGSTNGTVVAAEPVPSGTPVPLADGACIRLGAWTAITIRRAP